MSELRTILRKVAPFPGRWPVFSSWAFPVLLILLSLLVILPFFPALQRIPEAGSGKSLYIGSQMLEGKVPYRDFWDYRPPLIFFLNMLGLGLSRSGPGSWVVEWGAISAAGLLLFRFLQRYFGTLPAGLASTGTVLALTAVQNYGNLPEEFALPFQALTLFLLVHSMERSNDGWQLFVIGIATGLATSLRLTLFGTGLVVTLYLFFARWYRRDWRGLLKLLWIGAGIGFVWGIWIVYFLWVQALPDFIDQVFRYHLFTLRTGNPQRLNAILLAIDTYFHGAAFFAMGLVAWLAVVPFFLFHEAGFRRWITGRVFGGLVMLLGLGLTFNSLYDDVSRGLFAFSAMSIYRTAMLVCGLLLFGFAVLIFSGRFRLILALGLRRFQPRECSRLFLPLTIAFFDLPFQVMVAGLPASTDMALFLPLLPSAAILVSFLLWSFRPVRSISFPDNSEQKESWVIFAILALAIVSTGLVTAGNAVQPPYIDTEEIADLQAYLQVNARPGDTILLWGEDSQVYWYASQLPVSRYLDQQAFFTKGYTTVEKVYDFWNDIRTNPPQFIIYSHSWNKPLLIPDDPEQCSQVETEEFVISLQERDRFRWTNTLADRPFVPVEIRPVYRWICENYQMTAQLGGYRSKEPWFLYRLKQAVP